MSVRQSLLAILDQGPCYGYQLRAEFARRTGATWPLNVGQSTTRSTGSSATGSSRRATSTSRGTCTGTSRMPGSLEVREWLRAPVERAPRDELAIKLTVAATLPGVDAADVIRTQRSASQAQLDELRGAAYTGPAGPEEVAWSLVTDARVFAAEAELRWLEHAQERLARQGADAVVLELSTDRPKRGRPSQRGAA